MIHQVVVECKDRYGNTYRIVEIVESSLETRKIREAKAISQIREREPELKKVRILNSFGPS